MDLMPFIETGENPATVWHIATTTARICNGVMVMIKAVCAPLYALCCAVLCCVVCCPRLSLQRWLERWVCRQSVDPFVDDLVVDSDRPFAFPLLHSLALSRPFSLSCGFFVFSLDDAWK